MTLAWVVTIYECSNGAKMVAQNETLSGIMALSNVACCCCWPKVLDRSDSMLVAGTSCAWTNNRTQCSGFCNHTCICNRGTLWLTQLITTTTGDHKHDDSYGGRQLHLILCPSLSTYLLLLEESSLRCKQLESIGLVVSTPTRHLH